MTQQSTPKALSDAMDATITHLGLPARPKPDPLALIDELFDLADDNVTLVRSWVSTIARKRGHDWHFDLEAFRMHLRATAQHDHDGAWWTAHKLSTLLGELGVIPEETQS